MLQCCSTHQIANSENDATECSGRPLACAIAKKLSIEGANPMTAFGSAHAFLGRCPSNTNCEKYAAKRVLRKAASILIFQIVPI
jgi:hypothetical protein